MATPTEDPGNFILKRLMAKIHQDILPSTDPRVKGARYVMHKVYQDGSAGFLYFNDHTGANIAIEFSRPNIWERVYEHIDNLGYVIH